MGATGISGGAFLPSTSYTLTGSTYTLAGSTNISGTGISFDGLSPTSHPINFTGITLAASSNLIRGTSVAPTRASGWISFSGTVGATPAQVYTDYRELHTSGVAEVLGFGAFPFMDSGASCVSMFAVQAICEVDPGSTVLTGAGAPGVGIFPIFAKCLLNDCTFNSGGQAAAAFLSVQANVVSVVGQLSSVAYLEVASGAVKDVFYMKATGGVFATNLFTLSTETAPVVTWEPSITPENDAPTKGIRFAIGSTVYNIPAYVVP